MAAAWAAGADTTFHKPSNLLYLVQRGPFYAIEIETGIMISMGALKIDERLRRLDPEGGPVPGLYSVGCDAATCSAKPKPCPSPAPRKDSRGPRAGWRLTTSQPRRRPTG